MECSLERVLSGAGRHRNPCESEGPSSAPLDPRDHCSRRGRHARCHHMHRGPEVVGGGLPTAGPEEHWVVPEPDKLDRTEVGEAVGRGVDRRKPVAAGIFEGHSSGGNSGGAEERAVRSAGDVVHARGAMPVVEVGGNRAGQGGRRRVRDSGARRQVAGYSRSLGAVDAVGAVGATDVVGVVDGSHHDRSHRDLYHYDRLEEGHTRDNRPGHRSGARAEEPEEEVRNCRTWFSSRDCPARNSNLEVKQE
jgi:hypothetical protein